MELKYYADNSSHLTVTMRVLDETTGRILELGTGQYSTPLIHFACYSNKREIVSYEHDPEYYRAAKQFESDYHAIYMVENWAHIDIQRHWDVALIDHSPRERRIEEIKRLAWWANYIVIPDVDDALLKAINAKFLYGITYHGLMNKRTVLVSNLIDLTTCQIDRSI